MVLWIPGISRSDWINAVLFIELPFVCVLRMTREDVPST